MFKNFLKLRFDTQRAKWKSACLGLRSIFKKNYLDGWPKRCSKTTNTTGCPHTIQLFLDYVIVSLCVLSFGTFLGFQKTCFVIKFYCQGVKRKLKHPQILYISLIPLRASRRIIVQMSVYVLFYHFIMLLDEDTSL